MTFTHLMNCVALTYGPIFTVYSGSNLGDHRIFQFWVYSVMYYCISSVLKMVLYATIIPFSSGDAVHFDFSQDALKISINLIELVLIFYSLKARNTFQEKEVGLKVLCVGLAWTFADTVCSNLLYFLMNATGEEFKWEYIQVALQANIELVDRIAVVALVECFRKLQNSGKSNFTIGLVLIIKYLVTGLAFRHVEFLRYEDQWLQLGVKAVFTVGFAVVSRVIFSVVFKGNNDNADYYGEPTRSYSYKKNQ